MVHKSFHSQFQGQEIIYQISTKHWEHLFSQLFLNYEKVSAKKKNYMFWGESYIKYFTANISSSAEVSCVPWSFLNISGCADRYTFNFLSYCVSNFSSTHCIIVTLGLVLFQSWYLGCTVYCWFLVFGISEFRTYDRLKWQLVDSLLRVTCLH